MTSTAPTTRTTTTKSTTTTTSIATTTTTTTTPTTVPTTIPDTTYTIEDTSTVESTHQPSDDQVVLIVAITLSAVVCIALILVMCILIYRRGEKKRKQEQSLEMESAFSPKNNRENDLKSVVDPRLSTILETGQSNDDTMNNSQSGSRDRYVNGKNLSATKLTGDDKGNAEPQYENFMTSEGREEDNYIDPNPHDGETKIAKITRQMPKKDETNPPNSLYEDTNYLDPNVPTAFVKDAGKRRQKTAGDEKDTDSFYENLQANQRYGNIDDDNSNVIYQNNEQGEAGESFYEEPMQKDSGDIYVDMA